MLPVDMPSCPWLVVILTLKNRTLSPIVQRFIECAHEVTNSLASGERFDKACRARRSRRSGCDPTARRCYAYHFSTWPRALVEFADLVGQQPEPMRLPPPSPAAISRMEETLGWLRWLEAEDAKLV